MELVAALVCVPLAGALYYPLLGRSGPHRVLSLALLSLVLAPLPLLVPAEGGVLRPLVAVVFASMILKLYDAHVAAAKGVIPQSLKGFLTSLFNVFLLVPRRGGFEPVVTGRENLKRLAAGLAQVFLGFALLKGLWVVTWVEQPFIVEHVVKSLGFFVLVVGVFQCTAVMVRLLGGTAREPCIRPYTAVTPADFWRRYNRVVGQFMYEDVFKRVGGVRLPVLGTLAAFLVSGLIHEYLFSMALGRVLGYQMAYFLTQGVAAALTLRLRPTGMWAVVSWGLTLVFNLATVLLFLANFDHIVPFYRNPLPWGL